MTDAAREFDAFVADVGALLDGLADAACRERVEHAITADAAMSGLYRELVQVDAMLTWQKLRKPVGFMPAARCETPARRSSLRFPRFVLAAALLVAGGAVAIALAVFSGEPRSEVRDPQSTTASVLDVSEGTLMVDSQIASPGEAYAGRLVSLDTGEAEFMLPNAVSVRLRGATRMTIQDAMNVTMASGTAEFDCPPKAKGYTVHLPDGSKVVDLGTTFTVAILDDGRSRVTVLEGAVETVGADSVIKLGVYDAAEVRDGRVVRTDAVLAGDLAGYVTTDATGGVASRVRLPRQTGKWFGESVRVVGPAQGISPFDGPSMLQFMYTDAGGAAPTGGSEVYQAIDLRPYRQLVDAGRMSVRFTARFNRVAGDGETDTAFSAHVFAHAGALRDFNPDVGARAVGSHGLHADVDPATWQLVTVEAALAPGTEFAIVELLAVENVFNDRTGVEFDGHYADGVEVELLVAPPAEPPPPSEATLESDHNPAGRNHESTVPDSR